MISELKIRNFKSLQSVDLKLGHFNLLVGANASGKSNFLDALRFLQGLAFGLAINEILDGRPATSTSLKWDGIRGGSKFVAFRSPDGSQSEAIDFHVTFEKAGVPFLPVDEFTYNITFSIGQGDIFISKESLYSNDLPLIGEDYVRSLETALNVTKEGQSEEITKSSTATDESDSKGSKYCPKQSTLMTFLDRPGGALYAREQKQIRMQYRSANNHVRLNLGDMQFLDPLPATLRDYSPKAVRLGERGEGFAALIHEIESNGSKPALLEWLKELRPDEVDNIYALEGLNNDFMVAIKEGNKEFRAPVLSEGTLRFIALAAAFFQPSMPKVLVIEEIEKGLHPSRLRLLLELMRSQSKRTGTQVFATTHSPTLLNWLTEEDRKTTFVCTRDAESGATKMRSLADVPRLEDLIKKNYNLDQLFEEGWLESVLHES